MLFTFTHQFDPQLPFGACAGIQEAEGRGAKTGAGKQRSIQALPALHEERRARTDGDGPRIGVTWWRRHVTSSRCLLTAAGVVVQSCRLAGRTTVWLTAARTYMSRIRSECLFIRYLCEWVLCGLWVRLNEWDMCGWCVPRGINDTKSMLMYTMQSDIGQVIILPLLSFSLVA